MPAHDATSPDSEAMMAAIPMASTSTQLQERLDRERRQAAITRQREYAETMASLIATSEAISRLLDAHNDRTGRVDRSTVEPWQDASTD